MASRRSLVAIVACALLVVACTGTGTAVDPMAPPDVFASTPTIGEFSPATTAGPVPTRPPEIERTEILPVDPLTLEPRPGYDPIPMGDWMWGQPSPAGRYLAAMVGHDGGTNELRLIDIANWQVEGMWAQAPESGLLVTDEGTVYMVGSGLFQRLRLGDSVPEEVARLPSGFQPLLMSPLFDENLVTFGTRLQSNQESASIVAIDVTTGVMNEIALTETRVGQLNQDSDEPTSQDLYINPLPVWVTTRNRALVIHGDEDVVSEIDLSTGVVSQRGFDAGELASDPTTPILERSAAVSPDGSLLYMSGRKVTAVDAGAESWTMTTAPIGVMTVDTTTWQVRVQTGEPIAHITLSPRGDRILGWGFSTVEGSADYQLEPTGLYILDAASLTVLARHYADDQELWYGSFSFNEHADVGYASSSGQEARIDAIDLSSGEIIASIEGGDNLNLIGSIGVLHADAGVFAP